MAHGGLKYKCLILDHDDTCVESTATIHHPAHCAAVKEILGPDAKAIDLQGWFRVNHEPGIAEYLEGVYSKDEGTHQREIEIWKEFMTASTPEFYPGILELIRDFKERGGIVTVVSHSPADQIIRHYKEKGICCSGQRVEPDLIFGWDTEKEKRKPSPYCALEIMRKYSLSPHECLVVDDLTPGIKMATAAGVPSAAACWAHDGLLKEMQAAGASLSFRTVPELTEHVLGS